MDNKIAKNFIESLIFSADEPLTKESMKKMLSYYGDFNLDIILAELKNADTLNDYMRIETKITRNLSPAAMETLAIISYHQPVTRAEIEKIRGKPVFRGTLDTLLELKWIKPSGRRETPGRPVTWVTDFEFLRHFGLKSIKDLPKVDELESVIL